MLPNTAVFSNDDDSDDTTFDVAQSDTTSTQVAAATNTTKAANVATAAAPAPSTSASKSPDETSSSASEPDAPDIYQRGKAQPLFARTAVAPATNPVKATVAAAQATTAGNATLYQRLFASRPHPFESSVPLAGVRGVATPSTLPPPRVLAANPQLINAARSTTTKPGMPTGAWVKLMQAAKGQSPNGPDGLATATIARAMASYGAGAAGVPLSGLGNTELP